MVRQIDDRIRSSITLTQELRQAHADYARERWMSLRPEERDDLPPRSRIMLEESGIAGTNYTLETPSVKCLHAHYAHFRSTGSNPVGAMVHECLLQQHDDLL